MVSIGIFEMEKREEEVVFLKCTQAIMRDWYILATSGRFLIE